MPRISPTLEGFRAAFRRPLFTFAEITWRWVVGATATVLFFFGLFEYVSTLPVSRTELLFLRTRHPYLIAQVLRHILHGSLNRAVLSLMLAAVLITLVWVVAGSLGRMATVRAITEYIRVRLAQNFCGQGAFPEQRNIQASRASKALSPLMSLNSLRAIVALAAVLALAAAVLLAGLASPDSNPHPALAFFVFLPAAGLVCIFWMTLNWLLSLAAIFSVRDGDDALAAIAAALDLFRERSGAVLAVSSWVGAAHLVVFVVATTVVSIPLGFIPLVPWRVAVLAMVVITLAYFAIADWLYTARLAAYVCIAEMTDDMFAPLPPPAPIAPMPLQTTIDREELILSDLPHLAMEM